MKTKTAIMVATILVMLPSYMAKASEESQTARSYITRSYITGRVTYSTGGKPAEGVEVWARYINHAELYGQKESRDRAFHKAVTSKDGRYRIEGLQPGRYVVWLFRGKLGEASQWAKDWAVRKQEVAVPVGGLESVDFQFIKGAIIEGRVVSQATGKPVPGQYIGLFDSQESYRYVVIRNAVGDGALESILIGS